MEDKETFPIGRITFDEEKCLWRCMPVLKREMDCGQVMKELARRKVLSEKDQRLIRSKPTNSEKNTVLIDIIMNRTSAGFQAFVQALKDSGHKVAHQTLLDTLAKEAKETHKKLIEGGGPSDLMTGAEFHDNLPEHVHKTGDEDEDKKMRRIRRSFGELADDDRDSVERRASFRGHDDREPLDLEAAKDESAPRQDNPYAPDSSRQDTKRADQLSQMVEDSKEKIARLLAENRSLKKDLDHEHEKAAKEIQRLREQLKATPRPSSRSESEDRKSSRSFLQNIRKDAHDIEVAKQLRKMKAEILREIKQERQKEQALPALEPPKARRMSDRNPPPEKAPPPSSPLPVLLVPTPGLNKNDAWTRTLSATRNELAVPTLHKPPKAEWNSPYVPKLNENITTDWDDVPMVDWNETARTNWTEAPVPNRTERAAPRTRMSDPNAWLNRTEDNPVLYQHLKRSRPKKKVSRRNPVLDDGLLEDRAGSSDVEPMFRWSFDHNGKRMLTGFLTDRSDPYGKKKNNRRLVLRDV